ncbi:hypothetical protein [Helicobacter suis]|nr:hypothetical protein [Helicobacter suis]
MSNFFDSSQEGKEFLELLRTIDRGQYIQAPRIRAECLLHP